MLAAFVSVALLFLMCVGFLKIHKVLDVGDFKLRVMYNAVLLSNSKLRFIYIYVIRAYAFCRGWSLHWL